MLNKRVPSVKVGKMLASVAWRIEAIRSAITRSHPMITKETALTSTQSSRYDGGKIERMYGFQYTPIEECLKEIWGKIQKE